MIFFLAVAPSLALFARVQRAGIRRLQAAATAAAAAANRRERSKRASGYGRGEREGGGEIVFFLSLQSERKHCFLSFTKKGKRTSAGGDAFSNRWNQTADIVRGVLARVQRTYDERNEKANASTRASSLTVLPLPPLPLPPLPLPAAAAAAAEGPARHSPRPKGPRW